MIFKEYMIKRNLSTKDLADRTYLDPRTIEKTIGGHTIPDLSTIAILVYVLGIPKKEIIKYIKNLTKEKIKL